MMSSASILRYEKVNSLHCKFTWCYEEFSFEFHMIWLTAIHRNFYDAKRSSPLIPRWYEEDLFVKVCMIWWNNFFEIEFKGFGSPLWNLYDMMIYGVFLWYYIISSSPLILRLNDEELIWYDNQLSFDTEMIRWGAALKIYVQREVYQLWALDWYNEELHFKDLIWWGALLCK